MTSPSPTVSLFSDPGPAPDTAGSSAAADGFLRTDLDAPLLENLSPDDEGLACEHCGRELAYSGRGPRPRFCADHKDKRNREPRPTPAAPSPKPSSRKKKTDSAAQYGMAWAGIGYVIANKAPEPAGPPVGRLMQLQAGDAGPRLERLLGPYVDRIGFLKKLTSKGEDLGDLAALILPPLLTAAISLELVPGPVIGPILGQMLRPMAAELLSQSREQAETLAAMGEAGDEVNAAIDELLGSIFGNQDVPA